MSKAPIEDIEITPSDVRATLSEIDASLLPEETINQAIRDETLTVLAELPDDWDRELAPRLEGTSFDPVDAVELLIRRRAARAAFHASPAEVRRQALDAAVSYDLQAFRGRLNDNVDKAYELLGLGRGGTSAPFAHTTRHAPPESRERLDRYTREDRRG